MDKRVVVQLTSETTNMLVIKVLQQAVPERQAAVGWVCEGRDHWNINLRNKSELLERSTTVARRERDETRDPDVGLVGRVGDEVQVLVVLAPDDGEGAVLAKVLEAAVRVAQILRVPAHPYLLDCVDRNCIYFKRTLFHLYTTVQVIRNILLLALSAFLVVGDQRMQPASESKTK